jgi:DNA-binding SARP family transcriptional activator
LNSAQPAVGVDTRVIAGQLLLEHAYASGKTALIDVVTSLVEAPAVMGVAAPVTQARWFTCVGYVCFTRGNAEAAKAAWRKAEVIAKAHGLRAASFMAQLGLARQLLDEMQLADARVVLRELRPSEGPGRTNQVLVYKHALARCLLLEGQVSAAAQQIEEALDTAALLGLVDGELFLLTQQKAEILFAAGQHAAAEVLITWMRQRSSGTEFRIQGVNLNLIRVRGSLSNQRDERMEVLQIALQDARELQFTRFLRSLPSDAAIVCAQAIEANIETEFAVNTVRQRRLRAPELASASWPWPVRVSMLGHTQVILDNKPLTFAGRTQAKPLELLFYLASARDMRASNALVASCLWPDEDGARAGKSLETTTARLRKLLADDTLIEVAGGQTALDRRRVWSDWHYFAKLARLLTTAASTAPATDERVPEWSQVLLDTYAGRFMCASGDTPWIQACRQEATQRFVAAAIAAHAAWPSASGSQAVESFLEAAIAHEPLSETLALRLMQVYASTDRVADALRIYRQLRHHMSITLGLRPGQSIEQLHRRLLDGGD